jgi:hypothetical protein
MKKVIISPLLCFSALFLLLGIAGSAYAAKSKLFPSQKNIGITPKKGKVKYDSKKDEYAVTGGGANIWGTTDAFEYVYKQISGDVSFSADIHFIGQGAVNHRKAALMIRQSLDPGSAYADVAIHGDGLTSLQYRPAAGDPTKEIRSELKMPPHFRIERHGDQFTLYAGTGDDMKSSGPVAVTLKDPVYLGLAVCSHDANVLETAVFSNVKIEPATKQAGGNLTLLSNSFGLRANDHAR